MAKADLDIVRAIDLQIACAGLSIQEVKDAIKAQQKLNTWKERHGYNGSPQPNTGQPDPAEGGDVPSGRKTTKAGMRFNRSNFCKDRHNWGGTR